MDQELGHAALDRLEVAEAAFRGVALLDQLGDTILEAADRKLLAARELLDRGGLQMLELVVERFDEVIELARHGLHAWIARARLGGGLRGERGLGGFRRLC